MTKQGTTFPLVPHVAFCLVTLCDYRFIFTKLCISISLHPTAAWYRGIYATE